MTEERLPDESDKEGQPPEIAFLKSYLKQIDPDNKDPESAPLKEFLDSPEKLKDFIKDLPKDFLDSVKPKPEEKGEADEKPEKKGFGHPADL